MNAESQLPPCEWEAVVDPDAAARLFRAPVFAARRAGPTRGATLLLEWRDAADETLAEADMAAEFLPSGQGRLVHAIPPATAPHCPATPAAAVEESAWPDGEWPEDADRVVATLEGRRADMPLADGVRATLRRATLHAGAAELPLARLTLSGPGPAVVATMRDLASSLPLLPPRTSLAEEARALAAGTPCRPRRTGAPLIDSGMTVEDALRHLIGHLADVLAWHAPIALAGEHPTGVHQMRVALRRLRSALRAFRPAVDGPALRDVDARARDLASLLGQARDWDVFLGGLGAELSVAQPEEPRIQALLAAARERRTLAYAQLAEHLRGPGFRLLLWDLCALVELRPWETQETEGVEDFAAGLLAKRWRKLTAAGEDIGGLPDAEFHALRLDGKRLRYVAELFAPLWGRKRGRRFLDRLAAVQEQFGLANDAAVARALVAPLAPAAGEWATGVAEGWVLARSRRARDRATKAWEALMEAEPFWNQG